MTLNAIRHLLDASERIRRALLSNDTAALLELVADDYCGFGPDGGKQDRAMMLAAYGPGGVQLDTYEVREVTARILGDVGLVVGVGALRGRYGEHRFEHTLRFLDVYAHRGSAWVLCVSQVTELTGGKTVVQG